MNERRYNTEPERLLTLCENLYREKKNTTVSIVELGRKPALICTAIKTLRRTNSNRLRG